MERNATEQRIYEETKEAQYAAACRELLASSYCIFLNTSDTFDWACADASTLEEEDYPWAISLIARYGEAGMLAVMAVKRGCLWQLPLAPILARVTDYREALIEAAATALMCDVLPESHELAMSVTFAR